MEQEWYLDSNSDITNCLCRIRMTESLQYHHRLRLCLLESLRCMIIKYSVNSTGIDFDIFLFFNLSIYSNFQYIKTSIFY
jgi:hypothetical protein